MAESPLETLEGPLPDPVDLSTRLGAIQLVNPILSASGTFGYGLEFEKMVQLDSFGGLVTKGLSLEPIVGNPAPRICETRAGMLNSIGLQNIGIDQFLDEVLPELSAFAPRIFVNLFGTEPAHYTRLAERVDRYAAVAAIELNVSCPNVEKGGIEFGHDPAMLEGLVASVRAVTKKPIVVKLSPNVTSPVLLAEAAQRGGADILSAINTVIGMAIDTNSRRPKLHTVKGGLSGPAIKPIALRIVFDVARNVDLPVIGIGGIESVDDVLEFLLAGASAVQVGTTLFRDPGSAARLVNGLENRLAEIGASSVSELVGAVRLDPSRYQRPGATPKRKSGQR